MASVTNLSSAKVGSTRLKKAGGSLLVTVPAAARRMLDLKEGQELAVSVDGTKITLEPVNGDRPQRVRKPRYSLDELLAQSTTEGPLSGDERDWQDGPAVGREVW